MHQPRIHRIDQLFDERRIWTILLIADGAEIVFAITVESPNPLVVPQSRRLQDLDNSRFAVRSHERKTQFAFLFVVHQ